MLTPTIYSTFPYLLSFQKIHIKLSKEILAILYWGNADPAENSGSPTRRPSLITKSITCPPKVRSSRYKMQMITTRLTREALASRYQRWYLWHFRDTRADWRYFCKLPFWLIVDLGIIRTCIRAKSPWILIEREKIFAIIVWLEFAFNHVIPSQALTENCTPRLMGNNCHDVRYCHIWWHLIRFRHFSRTTLLW